MPIHYQNDRAGMTVYPELKDEATNQPIEGTSEVIDTRFANMAKQDLNFEGQDQTSYEDVSLTEEELIEADADYVPSDISPVDLAEITSEIYESSKSPSQELASEILRAPMSDSAADTTVTYLAHKFYQGEVTTDEAYQEALNSGIPPEALAQSYRKLQSYLQ